MPAKAAAIILAAGFSSRMGSFKPLLDLGGTTPLERCVNLFRSAGIDEVWVVTGHRVEELAPHLKRLGVKSVHNLDFEEGMFSSVQAGVEALGTSAEAFFVLPVDLPLVRISTVQRLLDSYGGSDCAILYPSFQGVRGHPPLIAGWMGPQIAGWSGEGGLQGYLAQWEGNAREVEVPDEQILHDMDTRDDYLRLKERAEALHLPSERELQALLESAFAGEPGPAGHGRAVAEVAATLGAALNGSGSHLDLPLLRCAALLHDIARREPDHAAAGARLLRDSGYHAVADLVACHMDIALSTGPVTPAEILYLADKLVQGEGRVTLLQRFGAAQKRHAAEPSALKAIGTRLKAAMAIQKKVEEVLGRSLAEVIETT